MGSKPSKRSDREGVVENKRRKQQAHDTTFESDNDDATNASRSSNNSSGGSDYVESSMLHDGPVAPASRNRPQKRGSNGGGGILGGDGDTNLNGARPMVQDDDDHTFRDERVRRVPTKAVLKPLKNGSTNIADPEEDFY